MTIILSKWYDICKNITALLHNHWEQSRETYLEYYFLFQSFFNEYPITISCIIVFNLQVNDDELERELTLTKPPDMAAILAEERRIEQLHRRSYDTDSNYEQDSSHERDSGVELGHAEDWTKQPVSPDMSQHSRQSSEPFGASVTSSEEDEITKKEKEIIEVLEKEEQWRYENNREMNR